MKQTVYFLVFALIATGSLSWAASEDFQLSITPATSEIGGQPGGTASGDVTCDVVLATSLDEVTGWSCGVKVDPDPDVTMVITSITATDDLNTVNNGNAPGFISFKAFADDNVTVLGNCAAGECGTLEAASFTQGVVVDMMMADTLSADESPISIATLTVHIEGPVVAADEDCQATEPVKTGRIAFTDEVGDPATQTLVVYQGDSFSPAVQAPAVISLTPVCKAVPTDFTITAGSGGSGAEDAAVDDTVILNFDSMNQGAKDDVQIQGWSYGLCIADPTKLTISEAVLGADTATCNNGDVPGFDSIKLYDNGLTHGVVVDMMSQYSVPAQNGWEDLVITYVIHMSAEGESTFVTPCTETLGDPATPNVMVVGGDSIPSSTFEGTDPEADCVDPEICNKPAEFMFVPGVKVSPGNANGDARLDIADAIYLLNYLFRGGDPLPCELAGDANGDCVIEASDAVYIINYQFLDGPAPVWGIGSQLITPDVCPNLTCEEEQG